MQPNFKIIFPKQNHDHVEPMRGNSARNYLMEKIKQVEETQKNHETALIPLLGRRVQASYENFEEHDEYEYKDIRKMQIVTK